MAGWRRGSTGLAGRLVGVTLLVGVVTVLTAGAVAGFTAYRLAVEQVATGDRSAIQVVEDEVLGRLSAIQSVTSHMAEDVATEPRTKLEGDLGSIVGGSSGLIDRAVLADRTGAVVSATPSAAGIDKTPSFSAAISDAVAGTTGFRRVARSDGTWSIWLTRTVLTADGQPEVLLVEADPSFVAETLAAAAGGQGRIVSIVESGRPLLSSASADPPRLEAATWTKESSRSGQLTVTSAAGRPMIGYYSDLRGIEGVDWRITVVEPNSRVAAETFGAVAPTLVVLLLGGILGVSAAYAVSRRLVRPLHALEDTARKAATGTIVRPVETQSADEIGRVALAFNAMTLRLNALHDLAQLLVGSAELDTVLDGILAAMRHIVGPGLAAVYLVDSDGEWLRPARTAGVDADSVARVAATGAGWLPESLRQSEVRVLLGDGDAVRDNLPGLGSGESAALIAPLVVDAQRLGVIVLLRPARETITDAELEMVRTFSAQAAIAVQNSRLFAAKAESLRVAEALRSVAERLVRAGGLGQALDDVEEIAIGLFDAESARFAVLDRSAVGLPPAEDREAERQLVAFATRMFAVHGHHAQVIAEGQDRDGDDLLHRLAAKGLLLAPVALDSEHGAILLVSLGRASAATRDLELAEAIATVVALALDNAYFYERAVSRASNIETVFRISQAVGSSLQVNVVLNRVLDVVQKISSAEAVALLTYDTRKRILETAMARGAVPPELVTLETRPGEDVAGYVFTSGEPAVFRDLWEDMGGLAGRAAAQGLHSMIALPLLARGRSIGVLMVFSAEVGAFSDEDMSVLQTFASQAALALDTARLYSHEHEVASILQQSILPDALPVYPEIEAASAYQPAGGDAEIGGDYYDLFRGPDGSIWLAIADVCGKGVVAATKTSMIKYSVRALVAAGLGPSAVVGEVNHIVSETGEASDIVTLWAGRLDPEASVLMYASGGHPPAVVHHADGTLELTPPTGPLLGALSDVVYGEESLKLCEHDVVLLYTDGVSEARRGREFFGEGRIEDVVRSGGSPEDIVRGLLAEVRHWVQGELRDDIAVLAIALGGTQDEHDSTHSGEVD